jgi:hypothetical protein
MVIFYTVQFYNKVCLNKQIEIAHKKSSTMKAEIHQHQQFLASSRPDRVEKQDHRVAESYQSSDGSSSDPDVYSIYLKLLAGAA